jgi:hypothetical protein
MQVILQLATTHPDYFIASQIAPGLQIEPCENLYRICIYNPKTTFLTRLIKPPSPPPTTLMDSPWTATPEEVSRHFSVDPTVGLSSDQVRRHSERYGTNGTPCGHVFYPARPYLLTVTTQQKSSLKSQERPSGSSS